MRSLSRQVLYRIGLGVTAVIALSSGVSYYLLFRTIEASAVTRLADYSIQRGRHHEAHFALLKRLHSVVARDLVDRYRRTTLAEAERRFRVLMTRYPDGAMRNSARFADVERYSSGWIHRRVWPDAEFKRRWITFFDLAEKYKGIFTSQFANIYFLHPTEPANMGYDDPVRSGHVRWVFQTPADYALERREYFYLANPAQNPARTSVWGATYFEPAYRKILVPGLTPVYVDGRHIATIGTDDTLDDLEASILRSDIPDTTHTVFRRDGRLIIDAAYKDALTRGFDGVNIAALNDRRLTELLRLASAAPTLPAVGFASDIDQFYAISRLETPGWYFASTLPGRVIRAQAFGSAQWVLLIGLAALAQLLFTLAWVLRQRIGNPLRQLLAGIRGVTEGATFALAVPERQDEFGRLALAFNDMVAAICERDAALQNEKERFRALIEQGADVISIIDREGNVRYVSPSVERVLGRPALELIGRSIFDLVHPEDAAALTDTFRRTLAHPGAAIATGEYRRQHANGEWRWFAAIGTNRIDDPAVGGIVVNARDITEAKQALEQVQRQREALYHREKLTAMGSLLAGVAHELNNPLAIVVGRAIMLEEDAPDSTTAAAAEKIRTAADRCARIVKTFLSMARQQTPLQGPVAIEQVLDECLEILGYGLRSNGIELVRKYAGNLPQIMADSDQLHQVFINLIVNAQQALAAAPEPRCITVSTASTGSALWIEIADNGAGISAELRSRIFEPYFTTKPMGVGTGIGLAVSLGIVEAHGGSLKLLDAVPQGAAFRVELPIRAGAGRATSKSAPETVADQRCMPMKILIVDDEADVSDLLAEILSACAEQIDVVSSGREALDMIAQNAPYQAIVCDLRMPEMDGPTLYRTLREQRPDQADVMLFVTGDCLSPDVRSLLAETERPVIEKPFTPTDVRRQVLELAQRGEPPRKP